MLPTGHNLRIELVRGIMAQHDLIGHTLGQYTICERHGRGGMADVYKAFHARLEVFRAIKIIRPESVIASDFRRRLEKLCPLNRPEPSGYQARAYHAQ